MAHLQGPDPTFHVWGTFLEEHLSLTRATHPANTLAHTPYKKRGHRCFKSPLSSNISCLSWEQSA